MVLLLILFLLLTAYEYRRQLVKGKSKKTDEKNENFGKIGPSYCAKNEPS